METAAGGFCATGHFGNQQTLFADPVIKCHIFRRIYLINAICQNCICNAFQRPFMGSPINAPCQTDITTKFCWPISVASFSARRAALIDALRAPKGPKSSIQKIDMPLYGQDKRCIIERQQGSRVIFWQWHSNSAPDWRISANSCSAVSSGQNFNFCLPRADNSGIADKASRTVP